RATGSIVFVPGGAAEQFPAGVPGEELVGFFMPPGRLPPSGFVCFVPRSSVPPVHLSFEDAAKIIISGGMVNPETQARLKELARKGDAVPKPARLEAAQ